MARLVAGVDSSTQSTTVVVIDADTGAQVARGRAPHEVTGTGGARESDPRLLVDGAPGCHRDDRGGPRHRGHQHRGAAARPGRPRWLGATRAAPRSCGTTPVPAPETAAPRGGIRRGVVGGAIGSVRVPSFTVTRWAWLRETEPAVAAAARGIRLPHDFLTERLTGNAITDRGDASGSGWWSTATGAYDADILGLRRDRAGGAAAAPGDGAGPDRRRHPGCRGA